MAAFHEFTLEVVVIWKFILECHFITHIIVVSSCDVRQSMILVRSEGFGESASVGLIV